MKAKQYLRPNGVYRALRFFRSFLCLSQSERPLRVHVSFGALAVAKARVVLVWTEKEGGQGETVAKSMIRGAVLHFASPAQKVHGL